MFPLITFTLYIDKRELLTAIECVITTYPLWHEKGFFDLQNKEKYIYREFTSDKTPFQRHRGK